MSAFKKKSAVPDPVQSIEQKNKKLNLLLGLGSSQCPPEKKKGLLNRQLIMACAMFWDSKKRIDKIKSLILKQQGLQQFNDTEDFQVSELMSIQLLSLSKNNIIHLQPLSVLDTLICLNINHNRIYDISSLSQLIKLQQLYASNNQISYIDPLKPLKKLRIINLYSNKLNRLAQTINILKGMELLQQLDVDENPIYQNQSKKQFLQLQKLVRFNGQLILQQQRQNFGIMTSSVVLPVSKFRDTHTSFFTTNKSQVKTNITNISQKQSQKKIKLKPEILRQIEELQQQYTKIDNNFEQQIVKNVQLKAKCQSLLQNQKQLTRKTIIIKDKQQQIVQLKRKVKALKQNLFNRPEAQRKGELLRELFQLEMLDEQEKTKRTQTKRSQSLIWLRKFDFDQQIVIVPRAEEQNDIYLHEQDIQMNMLLSQNNTTLQQLKRELSQMTKDQPR